MARRRRVNKKVALLGTIVLLLFTLAAVAVLLRLNRDSAPLIADGDAARASGDYKAAIDSYRRAYGLTRSLDGKIDLLFKLVNVYQQTDQWDKVLGCWNAILTADPQNLQARLGQLQYAYILADGLGSAGRSMSGYWEDVLSQARKTMELVQRENLADADRTQWEPAFGTAESLAWSRGAKGLGPHLHFVKGRAAFELAAMGAVTSPAELLQEAQSDLQGARKLDPNNPAVYRYLAEVFVKQGEAAAARGNADQKNRAEQQADEILAEAVLAAHNVPEAHINLLTRKLTVAQRSGITITAAREQIKALEPQYEALTRQFASRPQVFAALGQYYSFYAAYLDSAGGMEKLNRAIQAVEQAGSLDRNNIEYRMLTASYHYRKFSVYGDLAAWTQAVELTEKALELPGSQDRPGPLQFAQRVNRLALCSLLGRCCVERLLTLPSTDPMRAGLVARVERAVHEIEQMRGGGEDPEVLKWRGMLDLAKGQSDKAVQSLYAAYEQIKANPPEQRDAFLAWTLAKICAPTAEMGAVTDFQATALGAGIVYTRPDALLDYADALLRAGSYEAALTVAGLFQERFGGNPRSRMLRIKALIAKGTLPEVEQEITKLNPNDPNMTVLLWDVTRAKSNQLLATIRRQELSNPEGSSNSVRTMAEELRAQQKREAELLRQLLQANPGAVQEIHLAELCEALIAQGDAETARPIVEAFLKHIPDNVTALFYRSLLSEPNPQSALPARRKELQEQSARMITDPVRRSLNLGLFYEQTEQWDQAAGQWQSVLEATASQGGRGEPAQVGVAPTSPRQVAAGHLFELARRQENWPRAGQIVELAKRENLDDCEGRLFAARLAFAKKEYDSALIHLNECLKQRPIFSYGYVLRSDVKAALGKEPEAIEDAHRASELNPMDALVAKGLAKALYARNSKLAASLSSEQKRETKQALEQAIRLDPRDPGLLNAYVDFLRDSEPEKAVALRQTIQTTAPSADNAMMLARLAAQVALNTKDVAKQKAFFTMAENAFEQARKLDPTNPAVLETYAAYFRTRGQKDRAERLLAESKERFPDDPRTGVMEALVAAGQGRYAEAIEGVDRCIQLAGPLTDAGLEYTAKKAQLLTTAYNATSDKTYLGQAIAVYESLRAKWPKNGSVLNNLAYLLAQNNEKLAEALEYARTAVEQDPDEANYLDTYGYLLYRSGRHAQAAQSLTTAVQKYELRGMAPADVYEHLGLVHEATGDRGKALEAYRRARNTGEATLSEAAKQRLDAAIGRLTKSG